MATQKENERREPEQRSEQQAESKDLKEREYRDAQGNIHHHTRTSSAMQEKGEGSRKSEE
jgi:hypothetical protein